MMSFKFIESETVRCELGIRASSMPTVSRLSKDGPLQTITNQPVQVQRGDSFSVPVLDLRQMPNQQQRSIPGNGDIAHISFSKNCFSSKS